jgi:anion-transporting  ArsA/GET3 family ATPase
MTGLGTALDDADVLVCCGSGGVGKTTTAAALGLELARRGRRVVVVTIDPAKRLADALGVPGGLGNEPTRLMIESTPGAANAPAGAGTDPDAVPGGELWATMLDTAATFDALVRAHAPTPEQAERILTNPFYRNIADALSGTQEYMAAERLHSLHHDQRFDVVVVDTPPTRNALDFLDAPGTLSRFLDHPLFRLMMVPARRGLKVLNVAAQPVLRTIGKVVGGEVLADAIAFFQAFEGMETGFRTRADEVSALLRAPTTRYVLVASPKLDTVDEARYFAGRLRQSALSVGALVVNRCTPVFDTPVSRRPSRPRPAEAALWDNLDELRATADAELSYLAPLLADTGRAPVAWVPLLDRDVHDLAALDRIRDLLFRPGVVGASTTSD